MRRTLLIVDDIKTNRDILKNMLGKEYDILEAADGREALSVIGKEFNNLSAVLLDLGMPVMDGYAVLEYMNDSDVFSQLPIIVMTGQTDADSEEKALSLGAKDYISKPYKTAIVKKRILNIIKLRETASTVNAMKKDRLTGLYNREAFFEIASDMIEKHEEDYYIMTCFDINQFKVINDQYGTDKGDEVLVHIAQVFKKGFDKYGGICGRISGDEFAVLYPAYIKDYEEVAQMRKDASVMDGITAKITFSIGRCPVSDKKIPVNAIYDRAMLAADSIKGKYDKHIAMFHEGMRETLIQEQQIVTDMQKALDTHQFEVWFQPQVNHLNRALVGSEALVRWNHPDKGMLSPSLFVPIFEQNGFIYELDKYVWEEVCIYLQDQLSKGNKILPVSVNVSRDDVFHGNICEVIIGLVEKYNIPVDKLRLEITESAFAKSAEQITAVVKKLIEYGFTLEIDDFGSGYSSLNTLKSVPAQIVKLDMKFLEGDEDTERGGSIIESIVRMTRWLGMSVIAEGVEKIEQADYLRSIGCYYIQGYLYAKPMPLEEFIKLCSDNEKEEMMLSLETVENLDNNRFWDPVSMDSLIFNSYVGAACIYEINEDKIELIRTTEKYRLMMEHIGVDIFEAMKYNWNEFLINNNQLFEELKKSAVLKHELVGEYVFINLPGVKKEIHLRSNMRVIASAGSRYLVYCISEDISAQREAEQKEQKAALELKAVLENINCGISATTVNDKKTELILTNDNFFELIAYTKEQYIEELNNDFFSIVDERDRERVQNISQSVLETGMPVNMEYRIIRGDGTIKWIRSLVSRTKLSGVKDYVRISTFTDISEERQHEKELLDNLSYGVALFEYDGKNISVLHLNKRYWDMVNRKEVQYDRNSFLEVIHPDDRDRIVKDLKRAIKEKRDIDCDVRIKNGDEIYLVYHATAHIIQREDKKYSIYAAYIPVDEARSMESRFNLLVNSIPGGIASFLYKDRKFNLIYYNEGFCSLLNMTRPEFEIIKDREEYFNVHAEDKKELRRQIDELIFNKQQMDCTYRLILKDNSIKWINIKANVPEYDSEHVVLNAVLVDVSQRETAAERIRISEEENRIALEHTKNAVCRFDIASRTLSIPDKIQKKYNISEKLEDIPYSVINKGELSPDTEERYLKFYEDIFNGEYKGKAVFQRKINASWRWFEAHFSTIFSDEHKPITAIISYEDITQSIEKESAYKKWQQSIHTKELSDYTLFRCKVSKTTIFNTREGNLLSAYHDTEEFNFNDKAEAYAEEFICKEDIDKFKEFLNVDTLMSSYYQGKRILHLEYREKTGKNNYRWIRATVDLVEHPHFDGLEAYILFENIDNKKRSELETKEQAKSDPLTGVLNRVALEEKINRIIDYSQLGTNHIFMMIDIDDFKLVNDSFGHAVGDKTLKDIASSIKSILRQEDYIGRLGGDEMVVFITDIPNEGVASRKAQQICALMRKAFNTKVEISGSIGISIYPRDGKDFDELYKKADTALYHVKNSGKDNYTFYHEDIVDEYLTLSNDKNIRKKKRILIVDDNKIDHAMLTHLFEEDYIIEKARDGAAALIRLKHYGTTISVVLLDLMMPGLDGFGVLKKMQESISLRTIPVIVVSSDESRETSLKAIREGAVDYVTKPIDPELLKIRLVSAIIKSENEQQRIKNNMLEYQNEEIARYRTILERSGTVVIEYDWINNSFVYDKQISSHIAGHYEGRKLWYVLLSEFVTDTETVKNMQEIIQQIAADRIRDTDSMLVRLMTPKNEFHWFRMNIYKVKNEFGLTGRIYMSFLDLGIRKPADY